MSLNFSRVARNMFELSNALVRELDNGRKLSGQRRVQLKLMWSKLAAHLPAEGNEEMAARRADKSALRPGFWLHACSINTLPHQRVDTLNSSTRKNTAP